MTGQHRLAAVCAAALLAAVLLCAGSGLFAVAWLKTPLLYGSADFVYACAGVNLRGRFRYGAAWDTNLAGLTPVYTSLPDKVCGYYPRPPFLPPYGYWVVQP